MATIASLVVKIGGNAEELNRALASVGEKAKGLDTDLKKLGNTPLGASAQKSLESMRATMDQITKAQQAVADRAAAAAQGIEQMGGASRLTDSQLKQMNRQLQEGLSAFKALGQDAPAHLKTVADSVSGLSQPLDFFDKKILAIGTAIGTFLGNAAVQAGQALVQAGKDAFNYADKMENLSAATGIGVSALQDLEAIGVTSGTSIETLANSVEQLQKHLDDPAARNALTKMGLDYEHIRSLKPEEQFLQIAQAVAAIEDPVERANAGSALFGRTWFTIAPAIKGNIEELVKGMTKLSDAQLEAIDKAGDRFDQFIANNKRRLTGYLGDLLLAADEAKLHWYDILNPLGTLPRLEAAGNRVAAARDFDLPNIRGDAPKSLPVALGFLPSDTDKAVRELNEQITEHAAKVKRAAEEWAHLRDRAGEGVRNLFKEFVELGKIGQTTGLERIETLIGLNRSNGMAAFAPQLTTLEGSRQIGSGLGFAPSRIPNRAATGARSFADDLFGSVPSAILAAIQGGGSKLEAAGSAIGSTIFGKDSNLTKTVTGGIEHLFGKDGVLTKTLSSAVPIIGSLIGPAIAGIQKLFGKSEESAKVSPLRDAFFKAAGGLDVLNPKVQALTGNLKAVEDVFKAKTVDDYNAAIQRLNGVLGLQDQAMADLNTAVQKYGFSIDQLGPRFAQQKLNEAQGVLLKDWKLLNEAVSDHNLLLEKTAGSFQEIVTAALKSGATVSEEFQGPIQDLINMGLLVDENGDKLTDLSRIKFGSLDTEFSKLTRAINDLTRALGGAVTEADNLARDRESTITVRTNFDTSDVPDSSDFPVFQGAEGFAEGTKGWRNFGGGTPAVLHGVEAVVTPPQLSALMSQASEARDESAKPNVIVQFLGPVLAATEYAEQHLAGPILNAIDRYHRPKLKRLVAAVST